MATAKIDPPLEEALLRASRVLVGVAARSLAGIDDVTLPQFRALVICSGRPVVTVSDLAEALDVHSTTATRLCDRLVDKGLIRRDPGVDDRRVTVLRLTSSARALVDQVTSRRRRDLATIASRMPDGVALEAVRALEAFAEAAGDTPTTVDLFGWDTQPR
jgi:DNA-binding MarR family transcriptional regulator